ncbi:VOC family protein [Saccharopolyspora hattusasensis]|uniref:VOC family protein n=1 Tax=Saccharopolyspora hattusasensis TaxID=1128679 RepID=UPI003D970A47
MITRAASIGIPVTDQAAAAEFFIDVLGFEKRVDVPTDRGRWIEVAPPGAETVLTPYTWLDHHDDRTGVFTRVVLECEDLTSLHEELVAKGVEFELDPTESAGGRFAHFKDPFGNTYVLAEL